MQKYGRIKFVPTTENPFDLIDNAKLVASAVGTACWEAAIRGKPAFIFGEVWFNQCHQIFHIKSIEDFREAFAKVQNDFVPNLEDIKAYATHMHSVAEKDLVIRQFHQNIQDKDPKNEMARIANAFKRAYDRTLALKNQFSMKERVS